MEPQPGSPTSPPFSPGSTLWDNARAATTPSEDMAMPSGEMAAPDETKEEEAPDEAKEEAADAELEPARKSSASSSSSSSSSSASSADIPCDIDVVELVNPLAGVPPEPEVDEHGAEAKPAEDERAGPDVHGAEAKPADCAMPEGGQEAPAVIVHSAEAKPDDWVTWPEPPPPAVDDSFASSDDGAAPTEAPPQVQAVSPANLGAAGSSGFDPGRIPASVFQHRASVSQAEWSMASNESLFSIQGASDLYPGSRSHFDFYYDEAMAEAAGDSKLPSLAEGAEPGDVPESREFAAPGSADSAASAARGNDAKKAAVFRRQESGSGGSSSNFSFAFPILAETSPRKKDVVVNSALYQPLEKEREPPPTQLEPPVSAFMEMTTEEERRRSDSGCCCCGCCWFDCSWCCRCPWWRCGCCCSCPCPRFCRCSWCLCS